MVFIGVLGKKEIAETLFKGNGLALEEFQVCVMPSWEGVPVKGIYLGFHIIHDIDDSGQRCGFFFEERDKVEPIFGVYV